MIAILVLASVFRFTGDNDQWVAPDKYKHLAGGVGTTLVSYAFTGDTEKSLLYSTVFWTLFEIKDGLMRKERFGKFGACGASYKDLVWSVGGSLLIYGVIKLIE